ncbi:hypothetical protein [Phenylobacterium sp.]|uniref:hypothetical protein n=1 Tax=Phenylobacterium sp. TaxID=1871053 RepID=UPI002FCC22C7
MPSTYSDELGIELQAAGENLNTWGDPKLNNALTRLAKGVAGFISVALTADVALTSSNTSTTPADFQARHAQLKFTGTGAYTVTVPSSAKSYLVWNACTGTLTLTTGAGTTAEIATGEVVSVMCDATNVKKVKVTDYGASRLTSIADPTSAQDAASKAYVDAQAFSPALPGQTGNAGKFVTTNGTSASWVALAVADVAGAATAAAPSFTGGQTLSGGMTQTGSTKSSVTAVAALDIDLSLNDYFTKSISGNSTFTFSNPTASKAQAFALDLTITSAAVPTWPASVKHASGIVPTLGNGRHVLGFITFDGGTTWTMIPGSRAAS